MSVPVRRFDAVIVGGGGAGLRAALTRGLKAYAELTGEKRGGIITADDVVSQAGAMISDRDHQRVRCDAACVSSTAD